MGGAEIVSLILRTPLSEVASKRASSHLPTKTHPRKHNRDDDIGDAASNCACEDAADVHRKTCTASHAVTMLITRTTHPAWASNAAVSITTSE